MTENDVEPDIPVETVGGPTVHSALVKADYLIGNSALFPVMVRAAASQHAMPFTRDLLAAVATNAQILAMLEMPAGGSLDHTLQEITTDQHRAPELDALILGAVQEYKEQNNGA